MEDPRITFLQSNLFWQVSCAKSKTKACTEISAWTIRGFQSTKGLCPQSISSIVFGISGWRKVFEEGTRGRVDQMLYNGEGRLTLLYVSMVFFFNQTEMVVSCTPGACCMSRH